ncbi:hypothetical protein [Sphingopyxis sp. PET50]|uniref:hypothetical protein n=1 Tax=Sphingopyxis sp. PET50 TaxID=2976533 RepID=UPI0021AEBF95|nr:hypothetical protein [Sphingopyxis sp. PET50]
MVDEMAGDHQQFGHMPLLALLRKMESDCCESVRALQMTRQPGKWEGMRAGRWGAAAAAILLAILLVGLAMRFGDLRWHDIAKPVREHGVILFVIGIVSIGGQSIVGALKWRLLQRRLANGESEASSPRMLVFYSALTALVGQVIPTFLASGMIRGAVTRFHLEGSFLQGAGITIYDQLFDVAVLALCTTACLSLFLLGVQLSHCNRHRRACIGLHPVDFPSAVPVDTAFVRHAQIPACSACQDWTGFVRLCSSLATRGWMRQKRRSASSRSASCDTCSLVSAPLPQCC